MRVLAWLLLLLAVPAVQAQTYKCVDEHGKTRYSDKPIADCKSATTISTPPPSSSPGPAASSRPRKSPDKKDLLKHGNQREASQMAAKKGSSKPAPAQRTAKVEPTEHDKKYAAARCKELREEEAWLQGPRGSKVEARDARLAQIRQALADCR